MTTLSAKLTQNNSLPAVLLTNRLLRVTAVVTMLLWVGRMPFLELHCILLICTSQLLYLSLFITSTTLLKSDQPTFSVLCGFKSQSGKTWARPGPRRPGWRSTYSFHWIQNNYFSIHQQNAKTFRNDIRQHFLGLHGSSGLNTKKFLNNGSFHACPGIKGPLSPDEG